MSWSGFDREPAAFPGVEAAVKIDCLTALGVEELGDPGRAGTDGADADNPIVDLVYALNQLIHRNVDRARDTPACPLIIGANVQKHPPLRHSESDITGLDGWHLVPKHKTNPSLVQPPDRYSAQSHECGPNPLKLRSFVALCGGKTGKWTKGSSALVDECHGLGNQIPAGIVISSQANPLLHGLAFPRIERHPIAGRDQLGHSCSGELDDQAVVDQHRENRLIDLDRIGSETGAAAWHRDSIHARVRVAERLEQRMTVPGHELLQQLRQTTVGELLAAGLARRAVLQGRIRERHFGDGVTTNITLLAGTPVHPKP